MFASGKSASVSAVANYIEDVFSTWLYTGSSSAQTITNGIDLAGKGGLVWTKSRSLSFSHLLADTIRGPSSVLFSDTTAAAQTYSNSYTGFSSTGYSLGTDSSGLVNNNGSTYASWTFRKQPKFFDVVTYTGDGSSPRAISHNLGSAPGCIIVKKTSSTGDWAFWHTALTTFPKSLLLNTTDAAAASATYANGYMDTVTSTTFTVRAGSDDADVNASGATYVAYLFAHDAGGFGLTGSDNVISCGSFTTDGSGNATVSLGYEPQWVMVKASGSTSPWWIFDNMRGFSQTNVVQLNPNTSNAENNAAGNYVFPTATGFQLANNYTGLTSTAFIYIAIRRGPMKVPTVGTSVFAPATRTGTGTTATVTSTISPIDMLFSTNTDRVASSVNSFWDRLRGGGVYLNSNSTNAEASSTSVSGFDVQNGVTMQGALITNGNSYPYVNYNFRRAPGFFDEVCWTGDGTTNQRISHNLGVAPELIITKGRSTSSVWYTYSSSLTSPQYSYVQLSGTNAQVTNGAMLWGASVPTSTDFGLNSSGTGSGLSGVTMVAYLFATCPGVSKVGSFTGTGATQVINCGFTGGARFVLIKRTDSTGDWYVWDTARGIVSGNDPRLSLNTTAAEVTTDDSVDTDSTGFVVNQLSATNINVTSATYIFLAIA